MLVSTVPEAGLGVFSSASGAKKPRLFRTKLRHWSLALPYQGGAPPQAPPIAGEAPPTAGAAALFVPRPGRVSPA
ncbi:hypothetical protein NN561_020300 [Cricetulus griseus]